MKAILGIALIGPAAYWGPATPTHHVQSSSRRMLGSSLELPRSSFAKPELWTQSSRGCPCTSAAVIVSNKRALLDRLSRLIPNHRPRVPFEQLSNSSGLIDSRNPFESHFLDCQTSQSHLSRELDTSDLKGRSSGLFSQKGVVLLNTERRIVKADLESNGQYSVAQVQMETDLLAKYIKQETGAPGVWISISRRGKMLSESCFGTKRVGSVTTPHSADKVGFGSISKIFVGLLVSTFISEQKLSWKTTIREVFPELTSHKESSSLESTVEQLLVHRAGISEPPQEPLGDRTPTKARYELMKQILAAPPVGKPGGKSFYAHGVNIVVCMLERLTGMSYEKMMTERIFNALGLQSCGFGSPVGKQEHEATGEKMIGVYGHNRNELGGLTPVRDSLAPNIPYAPGGSIHGSIRDLAKIGSVYVVPELRGNLKLSQSEIQHLQRGPYDFHTRSAFNRMTDAVYGDKLYHSGISGRGEYAFLVVDLVRGLSVACYVNVFDARVAEIIEPKVFQFLNRL